MSKNAARLPENYTAGEDRMIGLGRCSELFHDTLACKVSSVNFVLACQSALTKPALTFIF